jgi:hypothetical protein
MALFAIPNPKKTLTVPVNISKVADLIQAIPSVEKSYKFTKGNDAFKIYTLEAYEFLSLGIFADFSLNEVSPEKTEITIELRRKLGAFNEWHEVNRANKHLDKLVDTLANLSVMSDSEIMKLKGKTIEDTEIRNSENKKTDGQLNNVLLVLISLLIWPLGLYLIYKRFFKKTPELAS